MKDWENEMDERGWKAIEEECLRVYPTQSEPRHYGTLISWALGGNDPLRGVSVYDGGDYFHFVTFGLSELFEKESDNREISGYGMEFTLKLAKVDVDEQEEEIIHMVSILQTLARFTFEDGEVFRPYEYVYTGQDLGMDREGKSKITGFITAPDPDFQTLQTPNGRVEFVEFIGCTDKELKAVVENKIPVKDLLALLPRDVTSYSRKEVIQ